MAYEIETKPSLKNLAEANEKRIKEPINAEAKFSLSPEKTISALAARAYPGNPAEETRYAAKIKASLAAHLKEGQSMESLWQYLNTQNCQTTAIIEGLLKFFAGASGEKEIQIAAFLKPARIEAKTFLEKTYDTERAKKVADTRGALGSLLTELRETLPNMPA